LGRVGRGLWSGGILANYSILFICPWYRCNHTTERNKRNWRKALTNGDKCASKYFHFLIKQVHFNTVFISWFGLDGVPLALLQGFFSGSFQALGSLAGLHWLSISIFSSFWWSEQGVPSEFLSILTPREIIMAVETS